MTNNTIVSCDFHSVGDKERAFLMANGWTYDCPRGYAEKWNYTIPISKQVAHTIYTIRKIKELETK